MEKEKKGFDGNAKEALEILFETFWVLRENDPQNYQLIREREHILRRYVSEKFGFRLIVHRHFIKLEKIPVDPESWMGIQTFKEPMDYAIFACLLAFLESKSADEQFLLSELCEDLQALYPGHISLDWTNYEHRKSLIRVLTTAKEFSVVKVIDGEINDFGQNEDQEVLYEVPVISRYFMRSYPKDLFQFRTVAEILEQEWTAAPIDMRRHRVYRKLFLSPVSYRETNEDPDFNYLRNFRNRIREDIEEHTAFQFELYKNAALLTITEKKAMFTLFPDQKAIMDLVLQFSSVLLGWLDFFKPNEFGTIRLTRTDFEEIITACRDKYEEGWSKALREAPMRQLANDLFQVMKEWKMAEREQETEMILIHSLLGRTTGGYPADFKGREQA